MPPEIRLSSQDRRLQIIETALELFALHGFDKTTTKQIASKAGISEALLYKHISSKEELLNTVADYFCEHCSGSAQKFAEMEQNTMTLIMVIYYMVHKIYMGVNLEDSADHQLLKRLMFRSLLEEGTFAKRFFDTQFEPWIPYIESCFKAARAAGDMTYDGPARLMIVLVQHVSIALNLFDLPEQKIIDYKMGSKSDIANETVLFVLRGIGLKPEVIESYYQPKSFAVFFNIEKSE